MNDPKIRGQDADLLSLTPRPRSGWTRREFMLTTAAAGFALAVQPIQAQTVITTDDAGLTAGDIMIGSTPAYRAMPAGGKQVPVLLVVHEIFGVHEHIRDVCRRFAKLGYMAIAPDLFRRQGDVTKYSDIRDIMDKVVSRVPDKQVMDDLDAAMMWARDNGGDPKKLGITGFCWGGRIVWLYCGYNDEVTAGAAWYGRLIGEYDELHPVHPIDIAPRLKVPVIGFYGGNDPGIPLDSVEEMRKRLQYSGTRSFIRVYPEASHAFFADYRNSYSQHAAEDSWKWMQQWFKKYDLAPAASQPAAS